MLCKRFVVCLALCGAAASLAATAQQPQPGPQPNADARTEIASHIPGARPEQLRASPIQGLYEFTRGAEIAYVTSDGKYAITGDLYDLGANDDLTETHRREVRMQLMAAVPESEMVIFGPKEAKYTVTVFTDVDCGYCRKLHGEIAEYNRLGVRVRYLAYPRTGPNTSSWYQGRAGLVLSQPQRGPDPREARAGAACQALCQQPRGALLAAGAGFCAGRNPRHSHGGRGIAARLCPAGCTRQAPAGMRPPSSRGLR